MVKKGRIFCFGICNNIRLSAGCADSSNAQVVYIAGKAWLTPTERIEEDDFDWNTYRKLRKRISMLLSSFSDIFGDKRFIFDLDLNTEDIVIGKHKFLEYNLFIKQVEAKKITELKNTLETISRLIASEVEKHFNNYGFILKANKTSKND